MSKRMTSETVIFDTDWLTEADFDVVVGQDEGVVVNIDYQAYDTLKIIVEARDLTFEIGGLFQELDVSKIKDQELNYRWILETVTGLEFAGILDSNTSYVNLEFYLKKSEWENRIKGLGSIYIKGVKR